jgi:hypothetical protein
VSDPDLNDSNLHSIRRPASVHPEHGFAVPENTAVSKNTAPDNEIEDSGTSAAAPALWPEALALTSVLLLVSLLLTGWLRPADLWPF